MIAWSRFCASQFAAVDCSVSLMIDFCASASSGGSRYLADDGFARLSFQRLIAQIAEHMIIYEREKSLDKPHVHTNATYVRIVKQSYTCTYLWCAPCVLVCACARLLSGPRARPGQHIRDRLQVLRWRFRSCFASAFFALQAAVYYWIYQSLPKACCVCAAAQVRSNLPCASIRRV